MSTQLLLSAKKKARIKRDKKIRAEQEKLFREPGAMITMVDKTLMKKYGLSRSTIRTICQQPTKIKKTAADMYHTVLI